MPRMSGDLALLGSTTVGHRWIRAEDSEVKSMRQQPEPEVVMVYCTYCGKAHAVKPDEKPCAPGAWFVDARPVEVSAVLPNPKPPNPTPGRKR